MSKKKKQPKPLRLDLGCGQHKREGFTGVDVAKLPGVDVVHDLFKFPWPFADGSVEELHCSHFFEHVPAKVRPVFMDELFRILEPGAKVTVIVPDSASNRSIQDFTHEWPPVCPESFLYFNKGWRDQNGLSHYPIKVADFDFSWSSNLNPAFGGRSQEYLQTALSTMRNIALDLTITLTRRP